MDGEYVGNNYESPESNEEGTELVSEPTQVVVQPLAEEDPDPEEEPIAAPYLPWQIYEGETELRGTAYNRNASVFIEINGVVVEEFTPDELGQYGDFVYSYPTRSETDDVVEVYQVSESGLEGERISRTIQLFIQLSFRKSMNTALELLG